MTALYLWKTLLLLLQTSEHMVSSEYQRTKETADCWHRLTCELILVLLETLGLQMNSTSHWIQSHVLVMCLKQGEKHLERLGLTARERILFLTHWTLDCLQITCHCKSGGTYSEYCSNSKNINVIIPLGPLYFKENSLLVLVPPYLCTYSTLWPLFSSCRFFHKQI